MKIRQGHVSNSSSSSFVMIGIEVPADFISELENNDFPDWWYENHDDNSILTMFNGDTKFLLGKRLMDEVEYSEMTRLQATPALCLDIQEELEKFGIKVENDDIAFYAGSESE